MNTDSKTISSPSLQKFCFLLEILQFDSLLESIICFELIFVDSEIRIAVQCFPCGCPVDPILLKRFSSH